MKNYRILIFYIASLFFVTACDIIGVNEIKRDFIPKPCPESPIVIYGGYEYPTIQIGSQCWLQENLNIGTQIQGDQPSAENGVIEKYCLHNKPANCDYYGGLYEWDEMMKYKDKTGNQGICPEGWHIPTVSEWQILIDFVDADPNKLSYPYGYLDDQSYNDEEYNETGLSILYSAGFKYPYSDEYEYGPTDFTSGFWTSNELSDNTAETFGKVLAIIREKDKKYALSVRCIKD